MLDKNKILILCKVVDNFGDIGVVYRLARALSNLRPALELTLVVSNLETFHALAPQIAPQKPIQDFRYKNSVWKVVDWNLGMRNEELAENDSVISSDQRACPEPVEAESRNLPPSPPFPSTRTSTSSPLAPHSSLILECFQCGRPDWLENILFSDDFTDEVQILQIDYLTAEKYAEEFHLLKSGTRKTNIKKRFFMPGFTEKTGGLVINEHSGATCLRQVGLSANGTLISSDTDSNRSTVISSDQRESRNLPPSPPFPSTRTSTSSLLPSHFSVFYFAYDDDCSAVVQAISSFQEKMRERTEHFSVCVFVASGKSSLPFEKAWKKYNSPFKIEKIPFLPQEEFDDFLLKMDFLFVRGEDSLARACLSGLPFVWQAYKQDENYQIVKVNALLERMKEFFSDEEFTPIQEFWQSYNDYENPTFFEPLAKMLADSANQKNTLGFKRFAQKLHQNGNLAAHLLEYIDGL